MRDDFLMLRGPGDEVVTQKHHIAQSGPASVETTDPVSITVGDEVRRRGIKKMGLTGVMHVEAHLLDHVGNVGPSEGEVLKSPSQAAVGSRVTDGGPNIRGDHVLNVDQRGAGLTVAHGNTLKDVPSILTLVEEEVIEPLLYGDAEEVVERANVLHRELMLKSCSDTLEKLRARSGEDDVIDIE
jgi:hypothetical protein